MEPHRYDVPPLRGALLVMPHEVDALDVEWVRLDVVPFLRALDADEHALLVVLRAAHRADVRGVLRVVLEDPHKSTTNTPSCTRLKPGL